VLPNIILAQLADKTERISGMAAKNNQMIIFTTEDKKVSVNVRLDEEIVWLTLDQMAELFERDKSTISCHIKNVFDEGELSREATVANFATVQKEGGREVTRRIEFFNLNVIISVGYRVKSLRGTQFRRWATKRLNEYIRKGFTLDDDRLKNGGGRYFRELLQCCENRIYPQYIVFVSILYTIYCIDRDGFYAFETVSPRVMDEIGLYRIWDSPQKNMLWGISIHYIYRCGVPNLIRHP
jgi:prophage antirepressor-like protein